MKFGELKSIINRHKGRHDLVAVHIGLGCDGIIEAESPIIDMLDAYEVDWVAPAKAGRFYLADWDLPCIEVHLKEAETIGV